MTNLKYEEQRGTTCLNKDSAYLLLLVVVFYKADKIDLFNFSFYFCTSIL